MITAIEGEDSKRSIAQLTFDAMLAVPGHKASLNDDEGAAATEAGERGGPDWNMCAQGCVQRGQRRVWTSMGAWA